MTERYIETLILGAGPAGCQAAYFYAQQDLEYVVLEANAVAGSFFTRFPLTRELISINKINTGSTNPEFNLRHDWNSLLETTPQFSRFSSDYYPDRQALAEYLQDYARRHHLNIEYNTRVISVDKLPEGFSVVYQTSQGLGCITCRELVSALGLSRPVDYPGVPHYSQLQLEDLAKLKGQVLILGAGNSGFEVANYLQPRVARVLVAGHRRSISAFSHYSGDIRAKYLNFLDAFSLKSQGAIDFGSTNLQSLTITTTDKGYYVEEYDTTFEFVINALGWTLDMSIFNFDITSHKYPCLDIWSQAGVENLYFIGAQGHGLDYRQSSGGFIHGFRYLIRNWFQINHQQLTTHKFKTLDQVIDHTYTRINTSSGLYQMFGVLGDLVMQTESTFVYLEEIRRDQVSHIVTATHPWISHFIILEYGPRQDLNTYGNFSYHQPSFLHPRIETMKRLETEVIREVRLFQEELFADFSRPKYRRDISQYFYGWQSF